MEEEYIKKIMTAIILLILLVLSFFMIKPILLSIIVGIIIAFVFNPVYEFLLKKTKSPNFSASAICTFLFLITFLPMWFLTPMILEQSFKVFQATQQFDFTATFKTIFPSLFASESFSAEIGSTLHSFVTNLTNKLVNSLGDIILNFPEIFLHIVVIFLVLFFVLRDKEQLIAYIKSLSPLPKDVEKKFLESSKGITISVIYGQVIIGIVEGLIIGIGFLIFGIPNALVLTLLAVIAGVLPIIGTSIIWIPVAIYLIIQKSTLFPLVGIVIFGVISSWIEIILRPLIVSRRTQIHPSILFIGMIGGAFLFGIIGFILGPLILAYLLIILGIYRNKKAPDVFITEDAK